MKKITKLLVIAGMGFIVPILALADTVVSLTPVSGNYEVGKSYSVNVYINPQGVKVYTAKVEIKYPSTLLEVTNYTPATGLMPLTQSGYDLIDNNTGTLIKTAGITGGTSTNILLGTITVKAKATGSAQMTTTNNSQALDENGTNTVNSIAKVVYTITAPAPAPVPVKASPVKTIAPTPEPVKTQVEETVEVPVSVQTTVTASNPTSTQLAAVGATDTATKTIYWVMALIMGIGLAFGVGFRLGRVPKQ